MKIANIKNSIINTVIGVKTDRTGIDRNGNSWKSFRYSIVTPPKHVTVKKLPSGTRIRSQYTGSGILEERQILKPDGRQIISNKKNITILTPMEHVRFLILETAGHLKIKKEEKIPTNLTNLFSKIVRKQIQKIR